MRIAMKLGMSVRRAKLEVSSAEFADWVALYEREPWGEHIEDLRVGALMSLLYNMSRAQDAPVASAAQFTPWSGWSRDSLKPRKRSAHEIVASMLGVDLEAAARSGMKRVIVRNGEVIEGE
ncbi:MULTISPECIES: hypothetical protein [unclassified Caballeronia]|nr:MULTISPECIES: hypothetical protein [unclassified Caballeronia]MDR5776624.1 hypothetical protein [Caballeronia sp. LZ002]MDR5852066.1 hypothetical protein [Caballeronia sp. LZ003]